MTLLAGFAVVVGAVGAILLVPVATFFVETVRARPCRASRESLPAATRPSAAVLVPAHDEAAGIAASLATIVRQLEPGDRLLVVADNCSDDTAGVASAAGAEVVQRNDPGRRGKGWALDFGVRHLATSAPDVVVIVDADCTLHPGSLDRLARVCIAHGRPVQSLDLVKAPPGAGLSTRIAEFAWIVKNQVRPLGLLSLGLPCQLMGTGMAFPWRLLEAAPLATGHIVEDIRLGLDLAAAGTPPMFCPDALVTSVFAATQAGVDAQRTRWEHGHLGVIFGHAPGLIVRAMARRDLRLAALTLDLCVPPLSSLVLSLAAGLGVAVTSAAFGAPTWPASLFATGLAMVAVGVVVSWRRFGRSVVTMRELAGIPAYVASKLPLYARGLMGSETRWVRSDREKGPPP